MKTVNRIPSHLPRRLTISFPIWGLRDTPPGGAYHDWNKCMKEHVERGFNCIRLEDGAGLVHDQNGQQLGPLEWVMPFPGHSTDIRQSDCTGHGGSCDLLKRLIEFVEIARAHNVYVILSSWYYLHTCWYCGNEELNRELHRIPPHDRFMYFAQALDYILSELKARKLENQIAFAEVLNEADGLNFINGYDARNKLSKEELNRFRDDHTAALRFLRRRHPDILFAYDTYTPYTDVEQMPSGFQVWNFHNYFMWDIYFILENRLLREGVDVNDPNEFAQARPFMRTPMIPLEEIRKSRDGKIPAAEDWYRRVWFYCNLDPAKMPELETLFMRKLDEDFDRYKQKIRESLAQVKKISTQYCPGVPLVMGEGVSYCGSNHLLWEEHSDRYWELLEFAVREYRKAGLWGYIPRTCCGPEDPCWHLRADELLRLNLQFLRD